VKQETRVKLEQLDQQGQLAKQVIQVKPAKQVILAQPAQLAQQVQPE
jgi:hypothetical protein